MAWNAIELPPGRAACGCRSCGEVFTCVSAFDHHQTHDYGTERPTICHAPDKRGLVLYERPDKANPDDPWLIWGWPAATGESTEWYGEDKHET